MRATWAAMVWFLDVLGMLGVSEEGGCPPNEILLAIFTPM
jgi:hypothetical protein